MTKSIAEVHAELTLPGELFEMEELDIRGVRTRVWKNAPPTLRDIMIASRQHGDREYLVMAGEKAGAEGPDDRLISARTQLGGMRAIAVELPYAMVKHKFRLEDGDSCYCYAELIGDHLEIYERATQREFFLHPEQHSLRTGVLQGY